MHPLERSHRRRLGQNDLVDETVLARLVAAVGASASLAGRDVLEIGCGEGALTSALLRASPARLLAVDIDGRRLEALREKLPDAPPALELRLADATDREALRAALASLETPRVVGSLPYNVGTAVVDALLSARDLWTDAHVVLQLEVAARMKARARDDAYGYLSVTTRLRAEVSVPMRIPSWAFHPRPRVTSALVRLRPVPDELGSAWRRFERYLSAAFGQRRKVLPNALGSVAPAEACRRALQALSLLPTCRAEDLEPEAHVRLFRALDDNARDA